MTFVTKKLIPRRTILRGAGTALAIPLLDRMVPSLSAMSQTAAPPVRRFGAIYMPNGMCIPSWVPAKQASGADFELSPTLKPLQAFRDHVTIVSGLENIPAHGLPGEPTGEHPRSCASWLTGSHPKWAQGATTEVGISIDQVLAKEFGQHTQLASLELTTDANELTGGCVNGYSCAYERTVAWRGAQTPLPGEANPRLVFERLFGDLGSTDAKARLARIKSDRSILDSVLDTLTGFRKGLGTRDQAKLTEYLEAVRDVERRIQLAEQQSTRELPLVVQPAAVPTAYEDHVKLLYDLTVLAYQTDLTRIFTFIMDSEETTRPYPEIGVTEAHHTVSHHGNDPAKLEKQAKINTFHTTLFAYFLDKLRATPDGDGSLFDHTTLLIGCGMSDSNLHSAVDAPVAVVDGSGCFKGAQHVRYSNLPPWPSIPKFSGAPPLANLNLTILQKLGVEIDSFGDSTGPLDI
jgi:hypothetical protein